MVPNGQIAKLSYFIEAEMERQREGVLVCKGSYLTVVCRTRAQEF